MSSLELTNKLRELKELKAMQEELTAEIEAIQDIIKGYMTARELDTINVDVFKVTYKEVTSNRFDSTAFKKTHNELYEQYLKQTTTRRFVVA